MEIVKDKLKLIAVVLVFALSIVGPFIVPALIALVAVKYLLF
jgi:predicted Na+-dependent transporter